MLLAERPDEKTGQWVKIKNQVAYVNEKGAAKLSSMFASLVNNNFSMSNLNERDISKIIIDFGTDVINHLTFKFQEYDIKIDEINSIANIIINNSYACLKRALKEGERRFLRTSFRSQETIRVGQDQEREKRRRRWRI
jgi:hypothetical protein